MVYIFTNVHKFKKDLNFLEAVKKLDLDDETDTLIFLNLCVPFFHAESYFKKFNLITINRQKGRKSEWFGYDKSLAIKSDRITRYRISDAGSVIDQSGREVSNVAFDDYPNGKVPTTGYFAIKLVDSMFPNEKVVLVNFYGDDDSSTYKTIEHDWRFENRFLKSERVKDGRCIFIEPPKNVANSAKPNVSSSANVAASSNPYFFGAI